MPRARHYVGLRRLDLAREVYDLFALLCPTVFPVTLADTDRAKEIACSEAGLSVRDAIHTAVMLNNDVNVIATFDAGFDRRPGIERLRLD